MKRTFCLIFISYTLLFHSKAEKPSLTDIDIQSPFKELIKSDMMMMEFGGARVVEKEDGSLILFSIGYTTNKHPSQQRTVAKSKAIRDLIAHIEGQEIEANKRMNRTKTSVETEEGVKYKIVRTLDEKIQTTVSGKIRGLPVVGTWKSADDNLYYIMVGGQFDVNGKLIEPKE